MKNLESTEIWRPVSRYEGMYEVSDLGRIKSLPRAFINKSGGKHTVVGKILNPSIGSHGYKMVEMCSPELKEKELVHRIVAKTFIPNPDNLYSVDHLNVNKLDNRVENLEWVSLSENTKRLWRKGLARTTYGEETGRAVLTNDKVREIRATYPSLNFKQLGEKFGVNPWTISTIVKRRTWKHVA